jgi:hypothetical protein
VICAENYGPEDGPVSPKHIAQYLTVYGELCACTHTYMIVVWKSTVNNILILFHYFLGGIKGKHANVRHVSL